MPTVLDEGVTIDGDLPPIDVLTRTHELAAAKDGETGAASVLQILQLIERADLPTDVQDALDLAESALQEIDTGSIETAMLADGLLSADAAGRGKMASKFVINAKLDDMAAATVKGRASGAGTGVPSDLAAADIFAILGSLVPARPIASTGVGQLIGWSVAANTAYAAPAGGTWVVFWFGINSSTAAIAAGFQRSIVAGGTTVQTATVGVQYTGISWRIA
jgi:hypothetical protein